jgi:hypothetical protein
MARKPSEGLTGLSTARLQAEMQRRSAKLQVLQRRYDKLAAKLDALQKEIAASGGAMTHADGNGINELSLVASLQKAVTGKTLGVSQAVDAVLAMGYVTTSPIFRLMVNQALNRHRDKFKKVSRGRYTAL